MTGRGWFHPDMECRVKNRGSCGGRGVDMFCVLSIMHRREEPAKISRTWEPEVEGQRSDLGGIKNHSPGSYCIRITPQEGMRKKVIMGGKESLQHGKRGAAGTVYGGVNSP